MRKAVLTSVMLLTVVPLLAQQIEVIDFARQKNGLFSRLFKKQKVATDKKLALLDFKTGEKGFEFKANGTTAVQVDEGDGVLTLKVPHKTVFIIIKHPDYGQLTWKVPHKQLKKKKHYQGTLLTYNPDKEYKPQKQWVVFNIEPVNAILTVDSTTVLVRDGNAQFNLPTGKHGYRVESPFYEVIEDTLELMDSTKLVIPLTLKSVYSYVTVKTSLEGCDICLDGESIGETKATSGHLHPGSHRLTVFRGNYCYYDQEIWVRPTEKKVIELTDNDLKPQLVGERQKKRLTVPANTDTVASTRTSELTATAAPLVYAPVSIETTDDQTEILIDTEPVGYGKWEGQLAEGFHAISTRKDHIESHIHYLWIDDAQPKTVRLLSPIADYGMLNIHSNVVGAEIYINDTIAGQTPCTVKKIPANKSYRIRLRKEGYRDAVEMVKVIANNMVDMNIKMKKVKK